MSPPPPSDWQSERESLITMVARSEERAAAAAARIAELTAAVQELTQQVANANDRIADQLAVAQRSQRPPRRPPPTPKPPPGLDSDEAAAFDARPQSPKLPKKKKRKKAVRPTGRKPLPEHLPADEHTLRPDCSGECGCADVAVVDEVRLEKLTVVQEHQRRRVVYRKTVRGKQCNARTTATSLPAPLQRSKVTGDWFALLLWTKFILHVPLDRIRRDLAAKGIHLAESFLVEQIRLGAELLEAIDGVHWKEVLVGNTGN